jgi:undecaprenyl-diphosphatase
VVAFILLLAAALLLGALLDTIDSGSALARWDQSVAGWGADHESSVSVDVLRVVTDLGGTLLVTIVVIALGAYEWFVRRRPASALFLGVVLVGIVVVNNALKWMIMRDRPDIDQLVGSAGSSFPSGHTATAAAVWAAIALVLGLQVGRRGRVVLAAAAIGIACGVAASRALLGVHWLTDVIGGLVVGWAWFLLVALAFGGRMQRLGDMVGRIQDDEIEAATPSPDRTRQEHPA